MGVALACATATSCVSDKEFLTEKPKALLTTLNAFDSSDQVLNTLYTGYYEYEDLFFPGMFGQGIVYDKSAGTDILDNKYQLSTHRSNFRTSWSTTDGLPKSYWDKFYKVISYGNLALAHIDDVTWGSQAERDRVAGEAYFLRGLSYLRLTELFGGVPLVREYSETPNYNFQRASREESYAAAIEDLLEAYKALPQKVEAGRAGKGAAAMYLAEAYLAQGVEKNDNSMYATAAKYAQECIDMHPIMDHRFGARVATATGSVNGIPNAVPEANVYYDLFVNQNVSDPANTEAVWVLTGAPNLSSYNSYGGRRQCTLGLTPAIQDYSWAKEYVEPGAAAGPWKSYSAKYGSKVSPAFHGGTGWAQVTPTWFTSYTMWDAEHNANSTEDYRYIEDVTVQTSFLCCDDKHSLYEQKVGWDHIDHSTPELAGIFFPIFAKESTFSAWDFDPNEPASWFGQYVYYYRARYAARSAEAYFLLAEAELRQGHQAAADAALNVVRKRSNANPISNITVDTILDERARELLFEEFRWATFLRMKPAEWKKRIYDNGMYSARTNADPKTLYPYSRRWAEYTDEIPFNYLPIPQTYIDLNTGGDGLYQNEGWK